MTITILFIVVSFKYRRNIWATPLHSSVFFRNVTLNSVVSVLQLVCKLKKRIHKLENLRIHQPFIFSIFAVYLWFLIFH